MTNFIGGAFTALAGWSFYNGQILAGLGWTVAAVAVALFWAWRHWQA